MSHPLRSRASSIKSLTSAPNNQSPTIDSPSSYDIFMGQENGSFPVQRWNGHSRDATDWNSLRRDPELYIPDANCLVYLYRRGLSRRGPSFRIPYDFLLYSACRPLIEQCLVSTLHSSPYTGHCPLHRPGHDQCTFLYLHAPSELTREESFAYHVTTRNFFAWLLGRPIVGKNPVSALLDLKARMDIWRDPRTDNFASLFQYVHEQGYGELRLERRHGNGDIEEVAPRAAVPAMFGEKEESRDGQKRGRKRSLRERWHRFSSKTRARSRSRSRLRPAPVPPVEESKETVDDERRTLQVSALVAPPSQSRSHEPRPGRIVSFMSGIRALERQFGTPYHSQEDLSTPTQSQSRRESHERSRSRPSRPKRTVSFAESVQSEQPYETCLKSPSSDKLVSARESLLSSRPGPPQPDKNRLNRQKVQAESVPNTVGEPAAPPPLDMNHGYPVLPTASRPKPRSRRSTYIEIVVPSHGNGLSPEDLSQSIELPTSPSTESIPGLDFFESPTTSSPSIHSQHSTFDFSVGEVAELASGKALSEQHDMSIFDISPSDVIIDALIGELEGPGFGGKSSMTSNRVGFGVHSRVTSPSPTASKGTSPAASKATSPTATPSRSRPHSGVYDSLPIVAELEA